MTAPHSFDNWTRANLTLHTTNTITALQIHVQIALTPYVANTGAWSTIPTQDLTITIEQQHDTLNYQFTPKPGTNLTPGTYTFAVQYNHASGG